MTVRRVVLACTMFVGLVAPAHADRIDAMSDIERCIYTGRIAELIAASVARGEPRSRTNFVFATQPSSGEIDFLETTREQAYAWTDAHPIEADASDAQRAAYAYQAAEEAVKTCLVRAGVRRTGGVGDHPHSIAAR